MEAAVVAARGPEDTSLSRPPDVRFFHSDSAAQSNQDKVHIKNMEYSAHDETDVSKTAHCNELSPNSVAICPEEDELLIKEQKRLINPLELAPEFKSASVDHLEDFANTLIELRSSGKNNGSNKCVEITTYHDKNWSLADDKIALRYHDIINHTQYSSTSRAFPCTCCVMCGLSDAKIPSQNKNICNRCDTVFWLWTEYNVVIKFCKGCKNFLTLSDFGDKPSASKCSRCRQRGRLNYFSKKKSTDGDFGSVGDIDKPSGSPDYNGITAVKNNAPNNLDKAVDICTGNGTNIDTKNSDCSSDSSSFKTTTNNTLYHLKVAANQDFELVLSDKSRNLKKRKGDLPADVPLTIESPNDYNDYGSVVSDASVINKLVYSQFKFSSPCSTPFHRTALKRRNSMDSVYSSSFPFIENSRLSTVFSSDVPYSRTSSCSFDDVSDSNVVFWSLSSTPTSQLEAASCCNSRKSSISWFQSDEYPFSKLARP